jgi:hypothetical protein
MKKYTQEEVDDWCRRNGEEDATSLFTEMLPKHQQKLDRLDKRLRDVLREIKEIFPDAQYYTASGGFHLVLGSPHGDNRGQSPQYQREVWSGRASIGDGDW